MTILQEVKTYKNLQTLIFELTAIRLDLSGRRGSLEEIVEKRAPKHISTILKYLHSKGAFEKEVALKELTSLVSSLGRVKDIELTIAVSPSENLVSAVFDWVKTNVGEDVVLKIKRSPSVVAGAMVSYEGRYGNFSTARKLKGALMEVRRGEIA